MTRSRRRPSSAARLLLAVVLSLVVVAAVCAVTVAAAIGSTEMVEVAVHEAGGTNVQIAVPCAIARAAVELAPSCVFDEIRREISREIGPVGPALRAAARALEDAPDAVLIRVHGPTDSVVVDKRGDRIRVRVRDGGDRVDVSVPLSAVSAIARRLDA